MKDYLTRIVGEGNFIWLDSTVKAEHEAFKRKR